ncbi:MAG TPA: hypothetical protein VFS43_10720 [Polyangiaceae bacterium]|nr:hypothetical protein [Polyangiaceae bacterium]
MAANEGGEAGEGEAEAGEGAEAGGGAGAGKALGKRDRDKLERMAEAFDKIDRLLLRLAQQGLQRMSASSLDELRALEQIAHHAALVAIERQIETLATHVRRYLERDPLFTIADYAGTVNKIWLLGRAARRRHEAGQSPDEMLDVIGEARRSYAEVGHPLVLQPLGATGWVTDTDFVGITVYFYVEGRPELTCQASNCKPCAYFGRDPKKLLDSPISDHVAHRIFDVAHGAFEFRKAKMSGDGRLSLHKELVVSKAPYLGAKAYASLAVRDWAALVDRLREGELHPVGRGDDALAYVEPAGYGPVVTDEKNARATCEVADARGATLQIEVPLRAENNLLLDNLEKLFGSARAAEVARDPKRARAFSPPGKKLAPNALFGRASVSGGRLKFFPFTGLYQQPLVYAKGRTQQRRVNEVHYSLEPLSQFTAAES